MVDQDIKLTVDMLVFAKKDNTWHVILVKRGNHPYKGQWCFPGGFVEDKELLAKAAGRELEEETGIQVSGFKQLRVFDEVNRDPRFRTVSVVHYAIIDAAGYEVKGGDDAAEAKWWKIDDIDRDNLAFDHKQELAYALEHLKDELV